MFVPTFVFKITPTHSHFRHSLLLHSCSLDAGETFWYDPPSRFTAPLPVVTPPKLPAETTSTPAVAAKRRCRDRGGGSRGEAAKRDGEGTEDALDSAIAGDGSGSGSGGAGGASPLPRGWKCARDPATDEIYYYHEDGTSTWVMPLPFSDPTAGSSPSSSRRAAKPRSAIEKERGLEVERNRVARKLLLSEELSPFPSVESVRWGESWEFDCLCGIVKR